jgi:subtilisin family serine protease
MFAESFTVGATRQNDTIANFSSRGPVAVDGSFRLKPDVSAPGVAVRSVVRNGSFRSFNGTSMAGPHAAGAVALIISANPALRGRVELIEEILMKTADAKTTSQDCGEYPGSEVPNPVYGFGRINVVKAVEEALKYTSTTDMKSPEIRLFPNPANTEITLAAVTDLDGTITIIDATGRSILSAKIENQTVKKLDISSLHPGIYYIRFHNQQLSFARTFIKM